MATDSRSRNTKPQVGEGWGGLKALSAHARARVAKQYSEPSKPSPQAQPPPLPGLSFAVLHRRLCTCEAALEAGDYDAFARLVPTDVASTGATFGAFARLLRSQAEDIAALAPQQFADSAAQLAHMRRRIVEWGG